MNPVGPGRSGLVVSSLMYTAAVSAPPPQLQKLKLKGQSQMMSISMMSYASILTLASMHSHRALRVWMHLQQSAVQRHHDWFNGFAS